ncbi:MAG: AAA family ATPase [Candidatus Sumerlaeota bacterium]|nr:AAA family ATPase [Candidatus Sumerlaeota bacterium]
MAKTAKPVPKPAFDDKPTPELATFAGMVGHERVIAYLRKAAALGRLPQAILFDGPPGVGKSSMAYALAKFLLAGGTDSGAAFERHAGKVARSLHPDLRVFEPSGPGGQIKVESVRNALDTALQMPLEGARKVFLIDPADRLNPSSANSLLKLVEEPPPLLTIVLVAESVHSVLPTIRSRSARLRLYPAAERAVAEWLVRRFGAAEGEAAAAALFSGGCPGRALELLGGKALADRDTLIAEWHFFQKHGFLALMRAAHRLANLGESTEDLLTAWTAWTRDALVAACSPGRPDLLVNRDRAEDLAAEASQYGARALGRCLECLIEFRADARRLINRPLFLENLLLRLGKALKQT